MTTRTSQATVIHISGAVVHSCIFRCAAYSYTHTHVHLSIAILLPIKGTRVKYSSSSCSICNSAARRKFCPSSLPVVVRAPSSALKYVCCSMPAFLRRNAFAAALLAPLGAAAATPSGHAAWINHQAGPGTSGGAIDNAPVAAGAGLVYFVASSRDEGWTL
jgi:hypothetical protein